MTRWHWFITTGITVVLFLISGIVYLVTNQDSLILDTEDIGVVSGPVSYHTEMVITTPSTKYEVRVRSTDNNTVLFQDNKEVEVLSPIPRGKKGLLTLPDTDKTFDITTTTPISDLTWESTPEQSAKYLKHLEHYEFKSIFEVVTSDFIEHVYQRGKTYKRVIILSNTIMVGDIPDNTLPDTNAYIDKYRVKG